MVVTLGALATQSVTGWTVQVLVCFESSEPVPSPIMPYVQGHQAVQFVFRVGFTSAFTLYYLMAYLRHIWRRRGPCEALPPLQRGDWAPLHLRA